MSYYNYNYTRRGYIANLDVECKFHPDRTECSSCGKKTKYTFTDGICKSCMKKAGYEEKPLTKKATKTKKQYEWDARGAMWARETAERVESCEYAEKLDSLISESKRVHDKFAENFLSSIKKCVERGWELSEKQENILNKYLKGGLDNSWSENNMTRPERVALERLIEYRKGPNMESWWYGKHNYSSGTGVVCDLISQFQNNGSLSFKQYRWVARFLEGNKKKTVAREMIEDTYREMIADGDITSNF